MTDTTVLPGNLRSIVDRLLARAMHGRDDALGHTLYRRRDDAIRRGVGQQSYYRHEQEEACLAEFDARLHSVWESYNRVIAEAGLPWTDELRDEIDRRIKERARSDCDLIQ